MSTLALLLPIEGVRITGLTERSHPLDVHVEGIRNGANEAFRAVYDTLANDLVSFAYGMLSDRRMAEDVVQQAFLELVRTAHRFKGNGRALRSWLYRSVRFGCLDEYRRRTRRPEVPHDRVPESAVFDDHMARELDPELERALASLTRRHRTAVLLKHVSGLSGEEIAVVLGTTRRAAYAVVERAEANLRAQLGASQ